MERNLATYSLRALYRFSLRQDALHQMTAWRATATLSRAVLTALPTVSTALIVCASADLFAVPVCSKATVSGRAGALTPGQSFSARCRKHVLALSSIYH